MGTEVGELSTGVDNLLAAAVQGWGMDQVWEQVFGLIEERVGKTTTETWLKPLRPLTLRDETFHIEVPSPLFRDRLLSNLLIPLKESLASVLGYPVQIIVHVGSKPQGELFPTNEEVGKTDPSRSVRKGGLVSNYTFSSFVVGASNQFAHAAARAVADHPGNHYNPLFIYGGVGLGKTHLVNAIGHETLVRQGRGSIFYLSSESFTNQLISHLRSDRMDDFKNKFRQAAVLILDDVQFLSGRERTQEEFFHTFNSLYDAHKQIVLTSDKAPRDIAGLEERLRNRFESGLIADIAPPDLETRVAIVQKKAALENLPLSPEVALYIAQNVSSNVRELEGCLTRLGALASMGKSAITPEFARQALRDLIRAHDVKPDIESIQRTVSDFFHIRLTELKSKKRTQHIAFCRQVAMYLCRKLTESSFPAIGEAFGRDHSTVIHAYNLIARRISNDSAFRFSIEKVERELKATHASAA